METIKMKGKGVQHSWLRGANLFVETCIWGSGDFVCLGWLRSEGNLLQAVEESWSARCVCCSRPGCTSASHADKDTWTLHVTQPARDPSRAPVGSWCDSGEIVFHGNFLLIEKTSTLASFRKKKKWGNNKSGKDHYRRKGFWLILLVLGKNRTRAASALLFAGAQPCKSQWC